MKFNIIISITIVGLFFLSKNTMASSNFFDEGKKLFLEEKYKDAKFKFEKDIVFDPKSEKSYLFLAKIFKKQKKIILEENNLTTVILLNPKNEEAIYFLALLNIEKSNFLKAKELIIMMTSVCKKMCSRKTELQEKLNTSQKSK